MNATPVKRFLDTPREKIKHAYLIICPKAGELKAAAADFLQKLFCEEEPACGVCVKCRKVLCGAHPDVLSIANTDASIKVKEVRGALPFIAEKPFEGAFKAVVVTGAEKMTTEAQNCLLKSIEEPPANTVFLLLARMENTILPTVSSRCEKVRISPFPCEEGAALLKADTGVSTVKAVLACSLAEGYLLEAKRLLSDAEYFELREKAIDLCEKIASSKNMGVQKYVDFLEEQKERFADILNIMQSYFFDLQLYKICGGLAKIKNIDKTKQIAEYSLSFTRRGLSTIIEILCETEKRFAFALNFRLAMENMLFKLLEVKHTW